MTVSEDNSPGDDYFNDLSQQPERQLGDQNGQGGEEQEENWQVPKPKRIACVLCRKRKLKCDGTKPTCGTCNRLQHDCLYDEVRRKSGPKRGYVKALEARLAQVETLLKTQDEPSTRKKSAGKTATARDNTAQEFQSDINIGQSNVDMLSHMERSINSHEGPAQAAFPNTLLDTVNGNSDMAVSEESFPWEMIGLGLDEPLPTQDVIDELNQSYFDKIHPSVPVIHRPRYYAAMNLAPHVRPPVCLRYAMWANAAAVTDKYEALQEHFYQRARKYIQQDEMKGHGETIITVAHCQTWTLLATYEFKLMYFPRAWMSSGRACRLGQMMGLHRLDGAGLDVKQCLPPPKDFTEREERRRTFWLSFCIDRYSSIGTGWPMTIEEKDILTNLPVEEDQYDFNRPSKTLTLNEALAPDGPPKLSPFGGIIVLACLFGRNLMHLHRPSPDDHDDDINGEFWKRHRHIDNILLNTALALPDSLRFPAGLNDPNIVFMNMNIHTSTICLHQAAIFKADKNRMPVRISAESKVRCITAAAEIASIMRQMNPFISFCLYVAARVFVQYLKSRPKDSQVKASLQFLLSAMHAIKRKNPLTESFLVQLDVDLESAGLEDSRQLRAQMPRMPQVASRSSGCPVAQSMSLQPMNVKNCGVTYGDHGIASYNNPSSNPHIVSTIPAHETFGFQAQSYMEEVQPSLYELPNRQRTPGSHQGSSSAQKSPQASYNIATEMDTSPDTSDNQRTPSSSTQSGQNPSLHDSNTDHSPPNHNNGMPSGQRRWSGVFDQSTISLPAGFDMNNFPVSVAESQPSGFVLPQGWGATGMTPVPTGMTPGFSGMNDCMGLTEHDLSQMLDGFQDWNPGMGQDAAMQDTAQGT